MEKKREQKKLGGWVLGEGQLGYLTIWVYQLLIALVISLHCINSLYGSPEQIEVFYLYGRKDNETRKNPSQLHRVITWDKITSSILKEMSVDVAESVV